MLKLLERNLSRPAAIIAFCCAPPIIVYVVSIFLFESMYECGFDPIFLGQSGDLYESVKVRATEISVVKNSYLFFSSLIIFYAFCVIGIFYTSATILGETDSKIRFYIMTYAVLSALIGSFFILFSGTFYELCIVRSFYDLPLKRLHELIAITSLDKHFVLSSLDWVFGIGVFASNLAWWFCGAAAAIIYLRTGSVDPSIIASDIRRKISRLRGLLYAATGVLLSNTICIGAWLIWCSSYIPGDETTEALRKLSSSQTFLYGTVMSTILITTFLPSLLYLRNKAIRTASYASKEKSITQWLDENDLRIDLRSIAGDFSAALSPMLAGPIGSLLGAGGIV